MNWLVTGASRGLGRHLALQLAERGHEVLACGRDESRLAELEAQAARAAGRIVPVVVDLRDPAQVSARIGAALERAGRVDGVVNNAAFGFFKPLVEHSERDLLDIVQVNLVAAMQICRAVAPGMVAQRAGHIVMIGSDLARRPLARMAPYVATKHALAGFAHSLLRELKEHGVKVTLVNPGIIDTGFGGGREGGGEESWSLRPALLARLILDLVELPGHAVVDEVTVHPLGQGDF